MRDLLSQPIPILPTTTPPPDLTGANSQYYHADDRYAAYLTGQQVIFDQTLYQNSMVITPDNAQSPWVYGTDWTVTSNDLDTATFQVAQGLLPSFNFALIKSITILHAQSGLPVFLNMATQSFYPRPENLPLTDLDPAIQALLDEIIARLDAMEAELNTVPGDSGGTGNQDVPVLLAFDINGNTPANVMTNESYAVNTYNNQSTIRPIQGSFFKDSLILTANGITLTAGTDYMAVGLNSGKTKLTQNPNGIYDLIMVTYPYVGNILVTYRAVGGDASVADLSAVYQNLTEIRNFLNTSDFLTADELSTSAAIRNILNKTTALENQMRVLLSPPANYGDSTNGVSVVKSLSAPDTGLHWWTIARLYQVSGSTTIIEADRMALYLQIPTAHITADVGITLDLTQTTGQFSVSARNVVQDVEFNLYGTVGTLANVTIPQFRVIWNADSTYASGAILQIGLNLPTLTATLAIEDASGVESCWLLDTTQGSSGTPLTPNDNTQVLPNGTSSWVSGTGTSTSIAKTMPNDKGYLIWNGTKSLATFDSTIGLTTLTNSLPNWFLIQDIIEVMAEFTDAGGKPSRVIIPMTGLTSTQRRGIGDVYLGTDGWYPVAMEVTLTLSAGIIGVQVEVHANMQTAPLTNLVYLVAKMKNSVL